MEFSPVDCAYSPADMSKPLTVLLPPLNLTRKRNRSCESFYHLPGVSDTTMADLSLTESVKQQVLLSESIRGHPSSPETDVLTSSPVAQKKPPGKKEKRRSNGNSNSCRYCIKNCKYNGKHKAAMVQCHLCQIWAHYDCVGEKEADVVGIWTCLNCRYLARNMDKVLCKVASLEASLKALQENNQLLVQLVKEQSAEFENSRDVNRALHTQVTSLQEKLRHVTDNSEQLDQLTAQLTNLSDNVLQCDSSAKKEPAANHPTAPVLMLGDATIDGIHGVTTPDGRQVAVLARPEASFNDLSEEMRNAEITEGVSELVLICGSSEAGSDDNLEQTKQDFVNLASKAKDLFRSVTIGSVLPPAKPEERVRRLNDMIRDACAHLDVTFVDNDKNFLFRDNSRDDAAFRGDTDTLTRKGILRLMANVGLAVPRLLAKSDVEGRAPGSRGRLKVTPPVGERQSSNRRGHRSEHGSQQPIASSQRQRQQNRITGKTQPIRDGDSRVLPRTPQATREPRQAGVPTAPTAHTAGPDPQVNDDNAYRYVPGQCNNCAETNHVTGRCRHKDKVLCRTCGLRGHKSKHHAGGRQRH